MLNIINSLNKSSINSLFEIMTNSDPNNYKNQIEENHKDYLKKLFQSYTRQQLESLNTKQVEYLFNIITNTDPKNFKNQIVDHKKYVIDIIVQSNKKLNSKNDIDKNIGIKSLTREQVNFLYNIINNSDKSDEINYEYKLKYLCNIPLLKNKQTLDSYINMAKKQIPKIPNGYTKIKVPADNYCFYHSIVYYIKNCSDVNTSLKDIFIHFKDGVDFKLHLMQKLLSIKSNEYAFSNYFKDEIKNIWVSLGAENGMNRNIKNNIIFNNIIDDIHNNLKTKIWGGGVITKLIALLYGFCINYYNAHDQFNIFELVKPINSFQCNENNTIYIYFDGENHYDALIKTP